MRRWLLILYVLVTIAFALNATPHDTIPYRHEVRIGYGDMIFESAMKFEFPHIGRPNTQIDYLTGHFFAEYQYYWRWWLSSGMQIDWFQQGWHDRREIAIEGDNAPAHYYYNLSVLPTIRFTFFRSEWVNLYAAAFVGLCINGGTEEDFMTHRRTMCYPAFGLTMFGLQFGKKGWYGAVEWGGLSALGSVDNIAMLSSRILTVSLLYQFNSPSKPVTKTIQLPE